MSQSPLLPELLSATHEDLLESPGPIDIARVARLLRRNDRITGSRDLLELTSLVKAAVCGYGPLQPLITETTTDVLVNGPNSIWYDHGSGMVKSRLPGFESPESLRSFAMRLASSAGRRLDDSSPYVDARLPDGARLHAVLPPIGVEGTLISLRFPARKPFSLAQWLPDNQQPLLEILRAVMHSRLAFLISGGTGSGKTTLLSAMLGEVPERERIVIVEDATELAPIHPHVVHLQSRHANVEGVGSIGLVALVRQTLRMRPDRVVLGECRGAEIRELLQALNTGHEGGCGTIHANTALDVPARLEALGALAGLPADAIASQTTSALDAVIHVSRENSGQRIVQEIACFSRSAQGTLVTESALKVSSPGHVEYGPAWPELSQRLDLTP